MSALRSASTWNSTAWRFGTRVLDLIAPTGQKITALGLYCNPIQYEEHKANLKKCIDSAHLFGTDLVCTFAGALEGESVEAAMPGYKAVFGELGAYAADRGVRLAFENCPMGGTWKRNTCNIAYSPRAWDMMFEAVPLANIGLEWEPAHAIKQLKQIFQELRNEGASGLISTHMLDSVENYWDIAHIMMKGSIAASCRSDENLKDGEKTLEQLFFEITEGEKARKRSAI